MMAYQLTLDKKYTDRAYFELESGAEFPDWNPKHFLDTADMISAYGLAYDWGYDAWTQEQREFIRNTLKEKGLMAAYNSIYGIDQVYWTAHRHNWNAVCNGAIGIGAMAIMDDEPEFASDLIEKTLRGMEYMLDGFAPDGGWREGTSYWAYTNEYYAPYMAMLDHAMGTTFHYFNIPGVEKTAYYYVAMEGSTSTFNYHNNGGGTPNAPSIFWYAQALNDPSIGMLRAALMKTRGLAGDFYDILWYRPEYAAADFDLPLDMSFREIETGMMRASWTDRDTAYVGYHGGRNNVEHTHYDMGEFIFDQMGVRWAVELGSDDYNMPDYFGVDSVYYRVRTEGHNTYVINPDQSRGQEYVTFCPIVKQESKERGAYAVLDLHSAYPNDTNSAIRGFMLGDNRKSLTIRDEIDKKDDGPLYWFMHTKAEVEIDRNWATLTQDGKQLSFEFVSNDPEAKLSVMDAVPLETSPNPEQQNKNTGIRKLVIQSSKKGELNITVKLYPKLEGAVYEGVSDTPIGQWTLPEGSINPPPLLDAIALDEQPLASFEPSQKNYVCMIEDLSKLPAITASSELPVEVAQAQAGSNIAKIVVSDPEDSTNKSLYTITFKVPAKAEVPEGLVRKNQVAVKASANPQQENMDFQVADGDLDTRWSADGDQWIQFDLGETTEVEAVALAWWQGNARVSYFDILISENGEDFSQVGSYETSGTTENFEIFTFAPAQARYVRVLGHGNETSGWNSILEMQVYGR